MNRREFIKAIGLAIAAPGAVLGAVKAAPPKLLIGVDFAIGEASSVIVQYWLREQLNGALKEIRFREFLVGDQWSPPLKGTNIPFVINRIHSPKQKK